MKRALSAAVLLAISACATAPAPRAAPPPAPTTRPLASPAPLTTVRQSDPLQPIVSFRLVFRAGSVDDPRGEEGITSLTARVLTEGGTQSLTSAQLLEALFPMAAELSASTDKEFTVVQGRVHKDFLAKFLDVFTDTLLHPRYEPSEFTRLKTIALNQIVHGLRNEDDETLGKVALDALLYEGQPYAHFTGGTEEGLTQVTLEDVKAHAARVFTQDRLVIGLAGPVDEALELALKERLGKLPKVGAPRIAIPVPRDASRRAVILEKPSLSSAVSMGAPTSLRRDHPDYFAVAFGLSTLGEHRQSAGILFQQLRDKRGLNYGDYAYSEHFIQDGSSFFSRTNIARTQQDLSVWLRPVVPANALFATRGALHFTRKLVDAPLAPEAFATMQGFVTGFTRLWEQSDQRRLGLAIDDLFHGTPDRLDRYRAAIATLTPERVQEALKRHVKPESFSFAFVTEDAKGLADLLAKQSPSPLAYASEKPGDVLADDRLIESTRLPLDAGAIQVRPASDFMKR